MVQVKFLELSTPLKGIGYTRLFGFTTTVAAIPVATTAAFQALYDVTDEEREAIRRFAATMVQEFYTTTYER